MRGGVYMLGYHCKEIQADGTLIDEPKLVR